MVIGLHSSPMLSNSHTRFGDLALKLFRHGAYGVDIFFALSGYLISTLLLREKEHTGTISLRRFYTRRAFRILPPVLIYLTVLRLLVELKKLPPIPAIDLMRVLFFARNYFHGPWYTKHFWSLAVEEHFYAFAPLLLLLLPWKWALRIALILIGVCTGIRWFEFAHQAHFQGATLVFRTENRFDALLWGGVYALVLRRAEISQWIAEHVSGPVVAIIGVTAVVSLNVYLADEIRRVVLAALMPPMITYTVLHPKDLAGRFLELPLMRWIGRISYSLYIWQMLFLPDTVRPLGRAQSFPLAFAWILLCAVTSYYLAEKPMIRLGHRLSTAP
ncbi:MAG: acyltransferase [Silvibacterium sp.]|nr:acyltransferase [Silvibacterium sp.]